MEMLDHRGLLERFSEGACAPPFLNFGMFPLDLRSLDFPHPHGLIIPQARVEQLLEEHAIQLGVEIRRGHEVTDLSQDRDSVTAEVSGPDGTYEIRAQYLVGCDGGHSVARQRGGFAFPGVEPTLIGRMGDVRVSSEGLRLVKEAVPELGAAILELLEPRPATLQSCPWAQVSIAWQQSNGTSRPSTRKPPSLSKSCMQQFAAWPISICR